MWVVYLHLLPENPTLSLTLYKERRKSCAPPTFPRFVSDTGPAMRNGKNHRASCPLLSFFVQDYNLSTTLAPIGTQTIVETTWSARRVCVGGTLLYVIENWLQLRTSEPTTAPTKKKHAHTYTLDPGALVTSSWWVQTWKKRKKTEISQVTT